MLRWTAIAILAAMLFGCGMHLRPGLPIGPAPDPLVAAAGEYIDAVDAKMPMWDADVDFAKLEQPEISAVKNDIVRARKSHSGLLDEAEQLRQDWNALIALDEMLHQRYVL